MTPKKSCFLPQYPPTNGLSKHMTTTAFPHFSKKQRKERTDHQYSQNQNGSVQESKKLVGPSKCIVQYSQIRKNIRYGLLFPQNDDVTQTYVECESSNLSTRIGRKCRIIKPRWRCALRMLCMKVHYRVQLLSMIQRFCAY